MNILREIERYVVLPFRFLRAHGRDCVARKQKCKVCGQTDGIDFKVRDDIWTLVVPKRWQNRVVCLRCFDQFAYKKGVDYVPFLTSLCFSGTQASFELSVVNSDAIPVWAKNIQNDGEVEQMREMKSVDRIRNGDSNSGDFNSGRWNSGNHNSGDGNSGDWNSGNCNSGGSNSGDYNSGSHNSGHYNSGHYNSSWYNSGHYNGGLYNSGSHNSGWYNSGDCNSGLYNSGWYNSGNCNSGDWNVSDGNSGCFCTETHTIKFFDKDSDWTLEKWHTSEACRLLRCAPLSPVKWIPEVDMTDEEKAEHPEYTTTGGYLKRLSLEERTEAAQKWWNGLNKFEKQTIKDIPNFDPIKFKQITGIEVD